MFIQRMKQGAVMGLIRRHDGQILEVLDIEERDGRTYLHIQGRMVDFWATPAELVARGYWLMVGKHALWDVWSPVFSSGRAAIKERGYLC